MPLFKVSSQKYPDCYVLAFSKAGVRLNWKSKIASECNLPDGVDPGEPENIEEIADEKQIVATGDYAKFIDLSSV